jgi:hypothetical protein
MRLFSSTRTWNTTTAEDKDPLTFEDEHVSVHLHFPFSNPNMMTTLRYTQLTQMLWHLLRTRFCT